MVHATTVILHVPTIDLYVVVCFSDGREGRTSGRGSAVESQTTLLMHALGILVPIVTAIYVYGRLTERVAGNVKELERLDRVDKVQWEHINDHESRISNVEGRLSDH